MEVKDDQNLESEQAASMTDTEETQALTDPKKPTGTERSPSAQQAQETTTVENIELDQEEEYDTEDDADPADAMAGFDWEELHERYHKTISTASKEEQDLLVEFADLMSVNLA